MSAHDELHGVEERDQQIPFPCKGDVGSVCTVEVKLQHPFYGSVLIVTPGLRAKTLRVDGQEVELPFAELFMETSYRYALTAPVARKSIAFDFEITGEIAADLPRMASLFGKSQAPKRTEFFRVEDGRVTFFGQEPGSYATMFGGSKGKLPIDLDRSVFNDSKCSYAWAFVYEDPLVEGEAFIFATSTFSAVGTVLGGSIRLVGLDAEIERSAEGEPLRVIGLRGQAP